MKNRKTKRNAQGAARLESDEARGIRESVEEMERELAELDRDIAEDIVEMIAGNRKLYQVVRESEELERRLGEEA